MFGAARGFATSGSIGRAVRIAGLALAGFMLGGTASALAANRLALVIGNDTYNEVAPLERAVADARAYRDLLQNSRGFEVFYAENARRRDMNTLVAQFLAAIRPGDIAMVVYSGHGVQLDPERRDSLFLLPVDFPNVDPGRGAERHFFDAESLNFARLAENVVDRGADLRIFVLDACRNNPFSTRGTRAIGMSRGLGRIQSTSGEFVIYAAAPGEVAFDSLPKDTAESANSVFTRAFIKHFQPGRYLEDVTNDVQAEVAALTKGANLSQLPYSSDGVPGWTCLDEKCGEDAVATREVNGGPVDADTKEREELFWRYCDENDEPAYCEAYLAAFPDAWRAPLVAARLEHLMRVAGVPTGDNGSNGDTDATDSTKDTAGEVKPAPGEESTAESADSKDEDMKVAVAPPNGARERSLLDPTHDLVRDTQARLTILGFRPGPVDGVMGQRTRTALMGFQNDRGLVSDGELTNEVHDQLVRAVPENQLQGYYEEARRRREAAAEAARAREARREEARAREREAEAAREREAARQRDADRDRAAREQAARDRLAREAADRERAEQERPGPRTRRARARGEQAEEDLHEGLQRGSDLRCARCGMRRMIGARRQQWRPADLRPVLSGPR